MYGNHLVFIFLLKANQREPFECSHIFKIFILICISKKNKSLTIAIRITSLVYMISMHFLHKININSYIHGKHVECDYFPLPSKFEMTSIESNY
jgi:hypothetical protein